MRLHAIFLSAMLALSAATLQVPAADHALLIGVNDYADPNIADLRGTAMDVQNMRRMLVEDLGFAEDAIMSLTEEGATRAAIFEAIDEWLINQTKPGDRIYLYFSGHGAQVEIPDGDSYRLTSGLVPYDADNGVSSSATTAGGLVLGSQLGDYVRRMQGRDVTIVVDACHSGSLTRNVGGPTQLASVRTITPFGPSRLAVEDITPELIEQQRTEVRLFDFNARNGEPIEGVAVWSAATLAQYSWDSPEGGIFTRSFIAGIRDREAAFDEDGRVTASSLLDHVRIDTAAYCADNPACAELGFTPELLSQPDYRATVIVPYAADAETLAGPVDDLPELAPIAVAELVELAEGVMAHENDFVLEAEILPGSDLAVGDTVRFRILSEASGRVVVLDTGPDGQLRRIFPNEYSEAVGHDGMIAGGSVLTIPDQNYPFEFTATDAGPGALMVLVAEPDVDLSALLQAAAFEVVDDPARALIAIAAELQTPSLSADTETFNGARKWAFATLPYLVLP